MRESAMLFRKILTLFHKKIFIKIYKIFIHLRLEGFLPMAREVRNFCPRSEQGVVGRDVGQVFKGNYSEFAYTSTLKIIVNKQSK